MDELGEEHIKTGKPICYTSADSVFQIAAHEEHFGLDRLYKVCEIAFKHLKPYNIARVIARPFVGERKGEFSRTKNRHDYSVKPPQPTVLDAIKNAGGQVISVGKIADIFAQQGITKAVKAAVSAGIDTYIANGRKNVLPSIVEGSRWSGTFFPCSVL